MQGSPAQWALKRKWVDALKTRDELRAAVGELVDDGRLDFRGRFHDGIDGIGANYVDGRQSELVCLADFENLLHVIASCNAGFNYVEEFLCHVLSLLAVVENSAL